MVLTIEDEDSTLDCSTSLSASSNNTTILPISNVVFGGTAPNCTVRLTPAANQYGNVEVTLTVSDGGQTATDRLTLTVSNLNDAPVISDIANQTFNEDSDSGDISFTASDTDNALNCSTSITVTSSNTTLLPTGNIALSGTAPNCIIKFTPVSGLSGASTVNLTLSDGTLTATDSVIVTVNNINDTPTISDVANQTIAEDSNSGDIAFTISDDDNTLNCSTSVTATSSDTTILPNANITFAGIAPNCTVRFSPAANESGSVTVTLTVSDGNTSSTDSVALTINAVNDAPTISDITSKATVMNTTSSSIAITVGDIDNSLDCSSSLSASSSNSSVVQASNITFAGTSPNCTATVTPETGATGTVNLTITVSDGSLSANDSFSFEVTTIPVVTVSSTGPSGNLSTGNVTYTLNLDKPYPFDVSVTATTSNGTATSGTHYTALSSQKVTITSGTTSKSFSVSTIDPSVLCDSSRTFNITLADDSSDNVAPSIPVTSLTGTIVDDVNIINSNITSDLTITCDVTIQGTVVVQGNTTLSFNAGTTLNLDDNAILTIGDVTGEKTKLIFNGTSGSRITVKSLNTSATGKIKSSFGMSGMIATYTDFYDLGTTDNAQYSVDIRTRTIDSTIGEVRVQNSTFERCGHVYFEVRDTNVDATQPTITVEDSKILNSISVYAALTTSGSGAKKYYR